MDQASSRRARMEIRIHRSLEEHDREDRAFWAALSPEVRIMHVWKLSEEQCRLRGEFPDEPGLCRTIAIVRRPDVRTAHRPQGPPRPWTTLDGLLGGVRLKRRHG